MNKAELEVQLRDALRQGDDLRKRTLRMALAAVQLAEIERREALDEADVLEILQKEAKMRRETIADAERAQRNDLVEAAKAELTLLESYLPQPFSDAELERMARQVIEESGATSPGDLGGVMKSMMERVQGRAEGRRVSEVVRRLLSGE